MKTKNNQEFQPLPYKTTYKIEDLISKPYKVSNVPFKKDMMKLANELEKKWYIRIPFHKLDTVN